jgi:flavin-dependent dehydrogenase
MREQVIVGAGLAGMVAAINLARDGYRVVVRERRKEVGGETNIKGLEGKVINIGDGTPIHLERMRAYTGIDLSGVVTPLKSARNHVYGKTFDLDFYDGVPTYLVERGPRPTSLDVHLFNLAVSEGVEFSFDDTVADFDDLPPQVNGARGAVLFSRGKQLDASVKTRFERELAENDGIVFDEWNSLNIGALPVANARNPRLFARNLILAGTLSGSIDPFLLFGVHGALVSGKVAAVAVSDHQKGLEEFRRINRMFAPGFLVSWTYRHMPMPLLKRAVWMGVKNYPLFAPLLGDRFFGLLPGYRSI